jgi:hypothetical protein
MLKRYLYRRDYRRKQKAGKKKLRQYERSMRSEFREQYKKERKERFKKFLANPFARKEPSPEQQVMQEMYFHMQQQRKEARRKWWQQFRKNPFRTVFVREKSKELQEMEQWRKVDKKIAFRNRVVGSIKSFKEIINSVDLRNRFFKGMLQSTAYFILSFLIIYIIYQLITIGISRSFRIPTVWYYYRVKFPLFTGSQLYTRSALIGIFASGPLISLLLAFFSLKLYFNRKLNSQNLKLFFLWGFICGLNLFFGSYIAGFITRTEFIYVTEWIFMSTMFDVEEIFFAITSISVSLLIGRLVTPLFLLSTGSLTMIESRFRLYYIITHVLIPWGIGVIVFFLLTTPTHYFPLFIKTLTPVFILLPSLFTYNSVRNSSIQATGVVRRSYFRWSVIIIVIAILFFYRILLNFGLQFF